MTGKINKMEVSYKEIMVVVTNSVSLMISS